MPALADLRNNLLLRFIFFAVILSGTTAIHAEQALPKITVYKSATCGCCNKWIDHLQDNGFQVDARNHTDMATVKEKAGVQPKFQSCHTALVDRYYVEGHVPAKDIKQLLSEKPQARGLAVPGMPMGSPGMEGHRKDPYAVLLINRNDRASIYKEY